MNAKAEENVSEKAEPVYARFDAAEFLRAMRTISALSDEVRAELDDDGLCVVAVDPAHVAYIRLTLPAAEGPTTSAVFVMNVEGIRDFVRSVLRSSLANPWLDLRLESGKVKATVGRMSKTFEFVDPAGIAKPEHLDLPGEKAAARVSAVGLRDALKIMSEPDDYVTMSLNGRIGDEGLVVIADGDDEVRYHVPETDMEAVKEVAEMRHPKAKSAFPTSYIQTVLEAQADAGGNVTLAIGEDYPLRMRWSAGGGEVEVLVAPRISNEE